MECTIVTRINMEYPEVSFYLLEGDFRRYDLLNVMYEDFRYELTNKITMEGVISMIMDMKAIYGDKLKIYTCEVHELYMPEEPSNAF